MLLALLTFGAGPAFDQAEAAVTGWCATSLRPADIWNTFTVDITVKRQRLTGSGDAIGAPTPTATYRVERSSRTGSWKTVVTNLSVPHPPTYAFSGSILPARPLPVSRLEDDENGTPVRAYDVAGALLTPTLIGQTTSANSSPRSIGQAWLDAFVAAPTKKTARQQAFEKAYGKATKVGTLNKYVRLQANGSDEVLVDPRVAIPVEANSIRNSKRIGHRTFTYGPAPDSALVRTNVHDDRVTSVDTGVRSIVDTTFSNICLEMRR